VVWAEGFGTCVIRARLRPQRGPSRTVRVSGRFRDCVDAGEPSVAPDGRGGLLVAWHERTTAREGIEVVKARSVDFQGRMGRVRVLGRGGDDSISRVVVAAGRDGAAAVLWTQFGSLHMRTRAPGEERFGRDTFLYRDRNPDRADTPTVAAAFNDRSHLFVAWSVSPTGNRLVLRARSGTIRRLGRPTTLGHIPDPPGGPDLQVAAGNGPGAIVSWSDGARVYARLASGGPRLGNRILVAEGIVPSAARAGGTSLVAWISRSSPPALIASAGPSGSFAPPVQLPGGAPKLAGDRDGNVLLATTDTVDDGRQALMLRRGRVGRPFGPPILIGFRGPLGTETGVSSHGLAAGGNGRGVLVWQQEFPGVYSNLRVLFVR
jgi:hypothetical protein